MAFENKTFSYNKYSAKEKKILADKKKKLKKAKRKKTRKDRLKDRLQPKPVRVPFTNNFMDEVCKPYNIPVLQEKWFFKKD